MERPRRQGQRGGWNAHDDKASAVDGLGNPRRQEPARRWLRLAITTSAAERWEDRDDENQPTTLVLVDVLYDTSALGSLCLRVVRQADAPSSLQNFIHFGKSFVHQVFGQLPGFSPPHRRVWNPQRGLFLRQSLDKRALILLPWRVMW